VVWGVSVCVWLCVNKCIFVACGASAHSDITVNMFYGDRFSKNNSISQMELVRSIKKTEEQKKDFQFFLLFEVDFVWFNSPKVIYCE
jgi:hypothetical protein